VEFALASVVFFMTIFGTIEFGLAIWQYNMMSDLAQEGARWASVHGPTGSAPAPATQANVQTYVATRTGLSVTVTTIPATVGASGSTISVRVASSFNPTTSFIPNSTMHLSSTSKMVVSR
jgi:Flp pilus assembly protein TadG